MRAGIVRVVASVLLVCAMALPARAADEKQPGLDVREFTCPIGGKPFRQEVGYRTFPLVTFPDGSYPGDDKIDAQIPVCPDNGLVILPDYEKMAADNADRMPYRNYSPAELAQLPALIADPAYTALKSDGRHMQAYWLATKLGLPAVVRFELLKRATWAATDPALRTKLVERLVAEGPALIDASNLSPSAKRFSRYYVVNGLRELGRFADALALIATIESSGPPVAAPADPDAIFGPDSYADQMRAVIADKNADRFPVRLMPDKWANAICNGTSMRPPYGPQTAATKAGCARRAAESSAREAQSNATIKRSLALEKNPAALARACRSTMPDKRDEALSMACSSIDEADGDALARNGSKLAADCDVTPGDQQSGALESGCSAFDTAVTSALEMAMVDDDAAFAVLCPGGGLREVADRAFVVSMACSGADTARDSAAKERLLSDPFALDAKCANRKEDDAYDLLASACSLRADALEQAEVDRLAADPAAFAAQCGVFKARLARPASDDETGVAARCRNAQETRERNIQRAKDAAAGVECFPIIGKDRNCVRIGKGAPSAIEPSVFDEGSSLSIAAKARAGEIIAKAKADRTYPKRKPGDRL